VYQEVKWVAIHNCMEAMLRICLYNYLYPKLANTIDISYFFLCFLFNKIREGRTGSAWKGKVAEVVGVSGGGG
jgi:hypothetical protein